MVHDTKKLPLVSIIIVNFNGHRLLEACLSSLEKLNYPIAKREIILVDNNSTDDSVPFVLKHFPYVKIVQNSDNLGFAGGNIAGFKEAIGEYIVLLNSDVTVDKNWLKALVERAQSDVRIGIISSRLRYATPFIQLNIESVAVPRSRIFHTIDHSPIGVLIEDVLCETPALSNLVYYKDGFYETQKGEISTRRTMGNAQILLPFPSGKEKSTYTITLHGLESNEAINIPVNLLVNGKVHHSLKLRPHETVQVELAITQKEVRNSFHWMIQNAGNIVLHDGYGKDRGSVVVMKHREQKEFYEEESPYFLKECELLSACGASCLIKREVIDGIGFLDGSYFMYYEDVEFSLRTWRAGWKVFYEPASIGYHAHRATTGTDESAFFLRLVERNHLAVVATHFPLSILIQEMTLFLLRFGVTTLKFVVFQFRDNEARSEIWRRKYDGRSAALRSILRSLPGILVTRFKMNRLWPVPKQKFEEMLY